MSFVCLLGLLIGAAPPPQAPAVAERDEEVVLWTCWGSMRVRLRDFIRATPSAPHDVGLPQFESPRLTTEEAAAKLEANPWLSPREQWARRHAATNEVTLSEVLNYYGEFDEYDDFCFGRGCEPVRRVRSRVAANFFYHPTFAPLLLESLQIRMSDRLPYEKGRRIARLIKPWMTPEQIHTLFGESKATIWDQAECRITYVDYGVSIDRNRRVTCRDDSPEAKEVRWDWFTPPERRAARPQGTGCAIYF